jgi:hypothetical protein
MEWYPLLKLLHILGTALGVGGTTLAEIFYTKFQKDGRLSPTEHRVLQTCYSLLRWGLSLLVFSGFGYLILWRLNFLGPEVFFDSRFLAKMTIVVILLLVSLLINLKMINMDWGSSISFSAWYAAMILGIWRSLEMSYLTFIFFYIMATAVVYFIFKKIRSKSTS